jgi:uncharacterized membrane protein
MLGINMLSKGLCGMVADLLSESHLTDWKDSITWIALIAFGTAFNQFITGEYMATFHGVPLFFWPEFWKWAGQAVVNIIAGVAVYSIIHKYAPGLEETPHPGGISRFFK